MRYIKRKTQFVRLRENYRWDWPWENASAGT